MARRYYNLEKETKAFLKRMEETRGVLPDGAGVKRVNDYILNRKGLGLWQSTRRKAACNFNTTLAQRLTIASNSSLQTGQIDFSFSFWVNPTTAVNGVIFGKSSGSTILEYQVTNNTAQGIGLLVGNGASTWLTNFNSGVLSAPVGVWTHGLAKYVAATRTASIQLNNGSITQAVASQDLGVGNAGFTVGSTANGANLANSTIDNIGFWKRDITSAENVILYNSGKGVSYLEILAYYPDLLTNLISFWQLSESFGTRLDWHGTNHLSPVNAPLGATGLVEDFF